MRNVYNNTLVTSVFLLHFLLPTFPAGSAYCTRARHTREYITRAYAETREQLFRCRGRVCVRLLSGLGGIYTGGNRFAFV